MRITIALIFFLFAAGCKKKEFTPVYDVPSEFQPYIDTFVKEAALRQHPMLINNLIIRFDSSLTPLVCAASNVVSSQNNVQKIISINAAKTCWQNSTQLETMLFHELGHCVLGRQHDTKLLPNGAPKSIMCLNDIALYSPCIYALGDSCNKLYRRTYYLDELFNPATPVPDWGK